MRGRFSFAVSCFFCALQSEAVFHDIDSQTDDDHAQSEERGHRELVPGDRAYPIESVHLHLGSLSVPLVSLVHPRAGMRPDQYRRGPLFAS